MKKVAASVVLCFISFSSQSQTGAQKDLVTNFFNYTGATVLKAFAHPTCSVYSTNVEAYGDHNYLVKIYYQFGSENIRYFSCEYKIVLNSTGNFYSVEKYTCGSPDASCFDACNFWRNLVAQTTTGDKDRFEKYLHKALDEFSCEEYCQARLFYKWMDLGYFSKY